MVKNFLVLLLILCVAYIEAANIFSKRRKLVQNRLSDDSTAKSVSGAFSPGPPGPYIPKQPSSPLYEADSTQTTVESFGSVEAALSPPSNITRKRKLILSENTSRELFQMIEDERRWVALIELLKDRQISNEFGVACMQKSLKSKNKLALLIFQEILPDLSVESPSSHLKMFSMYLKSDLVDMFYIQLHLEQVLKSIFACLRYDEFDDLIAIMDSWSFLKLMNEQETFQRLLLASHSLEVVLKCFSLLKSSQSVSFLISVIITWRPPELNVSKLLKSVFKKDLDRELARVLIFALYSNSRAFFELGAESNYWDIFHLGHFKKMLYFSYKDPETLDYFRALAPYIFRYKACSTEPDEVHQFPLGSLFKMIVDQDDEKLLKCVMGGFPSRSSPQKKVTLLTQFDIERIYLYAVRKGSFNCTVFLLDRHIDFNIKIDGHRFIQSAFICGQYTLGIAVMNFFGIPVNLTDSLYLNPSGDLLAYAVGNPETFEYLVNADAYINVKVTEDDGRIVYLVEWLLKRNALKLGKLLLEKGAKIDLEGMIQFARENEKPELLNLLAAHKSSLKK